MPIGFPVVVDNAGLVAFVCVLFFLAASIGCAIGAYLGRDNGRSELRPGALLLSPFGGFAASFVGFSTMWLLMKARHGRLRDIPGAEDPMADAQALALMLFVVFPLLAAITSAAIAYFGGRLRRRDTYRSD